MVVPLTMPITRRMRSPASDSRSGRISGMPPRDRRLEQEVDAGALGRLEQLRADVGEQLLVRGDHRLAGLAAPSRISARAGSMPPITSTTTSTSGSPTTAPASSVKHARPAAATSRSLREVAHRDPRDLERARRRAPRSRRRWSSIRRDQRAPDVAAPEQPDPHHVSVASASPPVCACTVPADSSGRHGRRRTRSSSVSRRTTTRALAVAHEHHRRPRHLVVVATPSSSRRRR